MNLSELITSFVYEDDSDASAQAKQLGLTYKGFGRWADPRTNKVTHKTDNGKLVKVDPSQGEIPLGDPKVEPNKGTPGSMRDRPADPRQPGFSPQQQKGPTGQDPAKMASPQNSPEEVPQKEKAKQLASLLQKHDWYFDKSDDQRTWKKGMGQKKEIEDFIKNSGIDPKLAARVWDKVAHSDFKNQARDFGIGPNKSSDITTTKTPHGSKTTIPKDKVDQYTKDVMKRGGDAAKRLSGKDTEGRGLDPTRYEGSRGILNTYEDLKDLFGFKLSSEGEFSKEFTHPQTGYRVGFSPMGWTLTDKKNKILHKTKSSLELLNVIDKVNVDRVRKTWDDHGKRMQQWKATGKYPDTKDVMKRGGDTAKRLSEPKKKTPVSAAIKTAKKEFSIVDTRWGPLKLLSKGQEKLFDGMSYILHDKILPFMNRADINVLAERLQDTFAKGGKEVHDALNNFVQAEQSKGRDYKTKEELMHAIKTDKDTKNNFMNVTKTSYGVARKLVIGTLRDTWNTFVKDKK